MLNVHAEPEKFAITRHNWLLNQSPKFSFTAVNLRVLLNIFKESVVNGLLCKLMY
jgi:hypothetical protein